jgi:TonB-linked SusC/RagA family outer membrane protein
MEKMLPARNSFRISGSRRVWTVATTVLLMLFVSGMAWAQQILVSGTVTSAAGGPLPGVTVRVLGTEARSITDANGKYSITAPSPDAVLTYALVGQRPVQAAVAGRTTIDVAMQRVAYLEEVVVTAYTEQRRADITGAVGSVNLESADRTSTASVLQKLDANVPGVTVDASGSPGSRSTVRIRGVSSFQNNDPLYIVDGTPLQDTYINFLNPDDITSIQVLKDASAASIYGSRASNGVIIIETTKKGVKGPPRVRFSARTGVSSPTRGYDDFLIQNSLDYFQVLKQSYLNAGYSPAQVPVNIYGDVNNPTVPKYIWPNNCGPANSTGVCTTVDTSTYSYPLGLIMQGSPGTNWWKSVFGNGNLGDYNLDIAGGGDDNQYGVSFNYFNQTGTAKFNYFKRGSVRVNTQFKRNKLNFGENVALSLERAIGGLDDGGLGEDNIVGKNILMQPVVPVYDTRGNFASGKAVGLGNQTNPLAFASEHQSDINTNNRIFGNVFGGMDVRPDLTVQSRFGFNVGQGVFTGFNDISPENSEPTFTNGVNENQNTFTDWTWSNTLNYRRSLAQHNVTVLAGQEAHAENSRFITGSCSNIINTSTNSRYLQDALCDASTKNVGSSGGRSALLSFFGKADYNYADKYVASFTLRQDGSSNLGPSHRWGTFPAFGLGWRITKEPFLASNHVFSDVMLRFGWGVTGNQLIPSGRIVSQFGGDRGNTFYDIKGSNTSIVPGFRQTSLGNPDLKWEENRSINVGSDLTLYDGKLNVVFDVFSRATDNLLFNPPIPGTAGIADAPIVNIGKMKNTGFDFSVGHRGLSWYATFNGSHYHNEIVRIDGVSDFFYGPISTRYGNQVINQVGHPIGSFYGLQTDGFFRDTTDVLAHVAVADGGTATCSAATPCQPGAAQGRIKFRDVDGDGQITSADRTIIGSPHPKFTAGLDLGYRRGNWDVSSTLFGTFGNKIFDTQMEYYVFRNFSTNVRKDLLTDSWTPSNNVNPKYPRMDINDNYSHALSDFYVKDGSYVRLRSLQVGYNVPPTFRYIAASRVYVQGENLFTITKYPGLDPSLPAASVFGSAGDIRDQYRGVDRGTYPTSRIFSLGIVTNF